MRHYPSFPVIPAQAGIHLPALRPGMGPEMSERVPRLFSTRLRGEDDIKTEVHAE